MFLVLGSTALEGLLFPVVQPQVFKYHQTQLIYKYIYMITFETYLTWKREILSLILSNAN